MGKIIIIHSGAAIRQRHGPFVGGAYEEVVTDCLAHLLLILVSVISRFPARVLQIIIDFLRLVVT